MKKMCFLARNLKNGGVRRVIDNLVLELDKNEEIELTLLTNGDYFPQEFKNIKKVTLKGQVLVWDLIISFIYLLKNNFDVIIYPKGSIPITHRCIKAKKIYIVNDLGYFVKELKAYRGLDTIYMKLMMRFSCNVADKIIAISESTKQDIVNRFHIKAQKVTVVYLGVEDCFAKTMNKEVKSTCLNKYSVSKPYIFYSGSISPRKNLLRTLQAFNSIKDKISQDLIITGRDTWGNTGVYQYIRDNLGNRVKIIGFVPLEDLVILYSCADLYIFPSLFEGFGLPILEAQACGCPVIASTTTSIPEVGGDSIEYFNPYDIDELARLIVEILNDQGKRQKLIEKGFENIKRFSWEKTANIILQEALK